MAGDKDKPRDLGCLGTYLLLVLALIVIDLFGVCLGIAAPAGYGPPLFSVGLLGLGLGVALGSYFSAKTKPPTAWSPYYGLILDSPG